MRLGRSLALPTIQRIRNAIGRLNPTLPMIRTESDSQPIQRTADTQRPGLEHMRVDHGRTHIGMTEQFLNRANIAAGFQQMSRKAVPERMTADLLRQSGLQHGRPKPFLHRVLMNMMPPHHTPSLVPRLAFSLLPRFGGEGARQGG